MNSNDTEANFIPNGRSVSLGDDSGWLSMAWRAFITNIGGWLLVALIYSSITFATNFLFEESEIPYLDILRYPLYFILIGGYMAICDEHNRTGKIQYTYLFKGFRDHCLPLVLLSLLALVVLFIPIIFTLFYLQSNGQNLIEGILNYIDDGSIVAITLVLFVYYFLTSSLTIYTPALIVCRKMPLLKAIAASANAFFKNIVPIIIAIIIFLVIFSVLLVLTVRLLRYQLTVNEIVYFMLFTTPILFSSYLALFIYSSYRSVFFIKTS